MSVYISPLICRNHSLLLLPEHTTTKKSSEYLHEFPQAALLLRII